MEIWVLEVVKVLWVDQLEAEEAEEHYQQQQQGYYSPYGADSRSSMSSNGYGSPGQYQNPYMARPPPPGGDGRDEILMVSDDRVMRLQMTQAARAALRIM